MVARRGAEVDDFLLYQIAKMYYIDGMTQEAVARAMSFSRSHVSRLLDRARERRVVSFVVTNPLEHVIEKLEGRLRELFDLDYVAVEGVSSEEHQGTAGRTLVSCLGHGAARRLPQYLAESRTVAVGLGRTLYSLSKHLGHERPLPDTLFLPAVGTTTASTPEAQSNIIVDNFSAAFGARRYFTNVPIVVDIAEAMSGLYQARRDELTRLWETVDTVVVGLGGPYSSSGDPFSYNQASEVYKRLVATSDAKGDILGTFFFGDGRKLDLGANYIRNGLELEDLRNIPRVLCIAGGPRKVQGILTALRMRYVNGLITDSVTASEIIQKAEHPDA